MDKMVWVLVHWLVLAEQFFDAHGLWVHLRTVEFWANLVFVNAYVLFITIYIDVQDWWFFFPRDGELGRDKEGSDEAYLRCMIEEHAESDETSEEHDESDDTSVLRFRDQRDEEPEELKVGIETIKKHVRLSWVVHQLLAEGALGKELESFNPTLFPGGESLTQRREACLKWFQSQECSKQLLNLYPLNHLSEDLFWESLERVVIGQDPLPTEEEGR